MRSPRLPAGWLALLAGVCWADALPAQPTASYPAATVAVAPLPLDQLPPKLRARVRQITEQPTLAARAPAEEFQGRAALYRWLLDHPDHASQAWRRLGTPCLEISDRGNGRFGWADDQGSDLHWDTILDTPELRIWYAEGRVRPGLLLPPMNVQAVLVLHHGEAPGARAPHIKHQADLFLHTDSKTAALVARLMGPSAPHMAEQCALQLEYFFSGLTRYLDAYPERADVLLFGPRPPAAVVSERR